MGEYTAIDKVIKYFNYSSLIIAKCCLEIFDGSRNIQFQANTCFFRRKHLMQDSHETFRCWSAEFLSQFGIYIIFCHYVLLVLRLSRSFF